MSMTFYYGSGSPYAWRVWLALEYKQLPYDLKMLSFSAGDTRKPEFLKLNPRHKVPVLVDNGLALYESSAIVEYLEDQYPKAGNGALFPQQAGERAVVRRLVLETDNYLRTAVDPMLRQIFFKPEAEWDAQLIAASREEFLAELKHFENEIRGDFLVNKLSAADFTLYPMLALALRLEKKKPDLALRSTLGPKLAAWMKRIEALPYFQKTRPSHWK
ncbi:MAG TPA: glutathione S-transferase family protein [Burkholderiales bacterium]